MIKYFLLYFTRSLQTYEKNLNYLKKNNIHIWINRLYETLI